MAQHAEPTRTATHDAPASLGAARPGPVVYRPWLHRFNIALVIATFLLIIMGGNVTSRGAGLSVPDGFTVYGYYLWSFPIEKWVGNILHEHLHRLMGSLVGVMCIIAAMLAWLPRWNLKFPFRFRGLGLERFAPDASLDRPAVRWVGLAVLVLVIVQGVLGGLRVSEISTTLAVVHGVHAQMFLCLTVLFAAMTSRLWVDTANQDARLREGALGLISGPATTLRKLSAVALVVVLTQVAIGAEMRHAGAGLAIPDFPSNLGAVVPPMSQDAIADFYHANPDMGDDHAHLPTPQQVGIHFAHRVGAVVTTLVLLGFIAVAAKRFARHRHVAFPAGALLLMLVAQIALGVAIILTLRRPNVATAHQALGAATFATTFLLALRLALCERLEARQTRAAPEPATALPDGDIAPLLVENAKA